MIAVDTNILVYAHRRDSVWHDKAAFAMKTLAEGSRDWAIPWPCLHEFLAIVTHPKIFKPPSAGAQAFAQIRAWLASPSCHTLSETGHHLDCLESLAGPARIGGPLFHDARVAAICLDHDIDAIWSADRDFQKFPKLIVRNPLLED